MAQRGPGVVTLGGVVEHDVEDHLETGVVHPLHHRPELGNLAAGIAGTYRRGARGVRREVADRVVAPVVGEAPLDEHALGYRVLHREQLHGRDPQVDEVVEDGVVREARVRATQLGRDRRMQRGDPLDVRLVDDGVGVRTPPRARGERPEPRLPHVHHDTAGHGRGGVARVVVVQLRTESDVAVNRTRVRVEEQLRRVGADAPRRRVLPGRAEAVPGARVHPGHEPVPHARVGVGERDLGLGAIVGEQAQRHPVGHLRDDGEVGATVARRRAERERVAGEHGARSRVRHRVREVRRHRPTRSMSSARLPLWWPRRRITSATIPVHPV